MNKIQWKIYWREQRLNKVKLDLSIALLTLCLKDLYSYKYTDKQDVFIRLVHRYKYKLDHSYFDKIEGWKPEAKQRAEKMFSALIYKKNPFLAMVKKEEGRSYVPVPIDFKK